jgi:hypothetical protein
MFVVAFTVVYAVIAVGVFLKSRRELKLWRRLYEAVKTGDNEGEDKCPKWAKVFNSKKVLTTFEATHESHLSLTTGFFDCTILLNNFPSCLRNLKVQPIKKINIFYFITRLSYSIAFYQENLVAIAH